MEPCSHYGRTPPCVDAIIKAGIKKVVAAMEDPNPIVAGRGFKKLREAGIKVKKGILEQKARHLNEVFIKYITTGFPFVMLKTAMTLDGKIATRTGDSYWITGKKSRQFVHLLRSQSDAIVVGIETVLKDDPLLTTRLNGEGGEKGRDATRVLVDSRARLPLDAKVINPASPAKTILAVTEQAPPDKCNALREKGVEILMLPSWQGRVDLVELMKCLAKREISTVLVEGGGTLNYGMLERGLVDKVFIFIAPMICGGREAPTAVGGTGVERLDQAWTVRHLQVKHFDTDLLLIGYPEQRSAAQISSVQAGG